MEADGADERGIFDKNKLLVGRPAGLHKGSGSSSGSAEGVTSTARLTEEADIDGMIEKSGCSVPYFRLEECLGEHDRDWRKCQEQVKELHKCSQTQIQTQAKR